VNKLKETQKKGNRTLLAIAVIGIAVYVGFEPLIKLVPEGVAQSVISSSFGAIFVIILTMYLLNKQTEIEQESKKGERVFDEKVKLYQSILDITKNMMRDGKITKEEINELPFPLIRLGMLGKNETVEAFQAVNNALNRIYSETDEEEVDINLEQKKELYTLLAVFAAKCREDLEIGDEVMDMTKITSTVATIASTGQKQKDYTKYEFDGKPLPKNQYIHKVIKNYNDENPEMTLSEFSKKVPQTTEFRKGLWVTLEEAEENKARDRVRHYMNPDEVIKLVDATLCVTRGQDQKGVLEWIKLFKKNGLRTE
jgi:hypothetical protein